MDSPYMEIWFNKLLLFPYNFIDYIPSELWGSFGKEILYFILTCDKKRIRDVTIEDDGIIVNYENLKIKMIHTIRIRSLWEFFYSKQIH